MTAPTAASRPRGATPGRGALLVRNARLVPLDGPPAADAQPSGEPEQEPHQEREVGPGHGQEMGQSGRAELVGDGRVEVAVITHDQRRHERPLRFTDAGDRPAQGGTQPVGAAPPPGRTGHGPNVADDVHHGRDIDVVGRLEPAMHLDPSPDPGGPELLGVAHHQDRGAHRQARRGGRQMHHRAPDDAEVGEPARDHADVGVQLDDRGHRRRLGSHPRDRVVRDPPHVEGAHTRRAGRHQCQCRERPPATGRAPPARHRHAREQDQRRHHEPPRDPRGQQHACQPTEPCGATDERHAKVLHDLGRRGHDGLRSSRAARSGRAWPRRCHRRRAAGRRR